MIAPIDFSAPACRRQVLIGLGQMMGVPYNVDQWDGYRFDRREILNHIAGNADDTAPAGNRINNVVFLTATFIPRGRATFRAIRETTRSSANRSRSSWSAHRSHPTT
jgi:hypothetical protein